MQTHTVPLWSRLLIAALAVLVLALTIPAYFDPANNPALAALDGNVAGLGSVAGAFLGRQSTIAILVLVGAYLGTRQSMMFAILAMVLFNLHDAVFLALFGGEMAGVIAGLVLVILAGVAGVGAFRSRTVDIGQTP